MAKKSCCYVIFTILESGDLATRKQIKFLQTKHLVLSRRFSADDSNVKICGFCSSRRVGWILIHYANDSSVFRFLGCQLHSWKPSARGTTTAAEPHKKRATGYEMFFPQRWLPPSFMAWQRGVVKSLSPWVTLLKLRQKVELSNCIEREAGRKMPPWNIPDLGFAEHLFNTDAKPLRF